MRRERDAARQRQQRRGQRDVGAARLQQRALPQAQLRQQLRQVVHVHCAARAVRLFKSYFDCRMGPAAPEASASQDLGEHEQYGTEMRQPRGRTSRACLRPAA